VRSEEQLVPRGGHGQLHAAEARRADGGKRGVDVDAAPDDVRLGEAKHEVVVPHAARKGIRHVVGGDHGHAQRGDRAVPQ